jgi:hypothetical protein
VELRMLNLPPHIQRAYLYGDWYTNVGAFFGEAWQVSKHTCRPFDVPRNWRHFRSMDWGFKTNGCVSWWALDPDNKLYCHRELMFKGKHPDEVAKDIPEFEKSAGLAKHGASLISGPADTQLWEERGDRGVSKAEEFARCGVRWEPANKKSRQRNAERLMFRLQDKGHEGGTGIVFSQTCRDFCANIAQIMPDPDNPNEPDSGYPDDHSFDAALYAIEYAERRARFGSTIEEDFYDDFLNMVADKNNTKRKQREGKSKVYAYG